MVVNIRAVLSGPQLSNSSIPPELAYMVNLEMLSMAQNELTELPKSFGIRTLALISLSCVSDSTVAAQQQN